MFHTGKLLIKKNQVIPFSILLSLCQSMPAMAQSENNLTPLQLRAMQTRKFSKPLEEVVKAIKTAGEDAGYSCHVYIQPKMGADQKMNHDEGQGICYLNPKRSDSNNQGLATGVALAIPILGPLLGSAIVDRTASNATTEYNAKLHSIKYEMNVNKKDGGVILRIRAYNVKQDQITNPDIYAKQFKMYGDSLFIQAIEINPAEQE
jgi:hypothetical protein